MTIPGAKKIQNTLNLKNESKARTKPTSFKSSIKQHKNMHRMHDKIIRSLSGVKLYFEYHHI